MPVHPEFIPPSPPELTPEAFYERWGTVSGLAFEQFKSMWEDSARQLGNDWEYHGQRHPQESLWVAMEVVDYYEVRGEHINRKVVIGAVMSHDAYYHRDYQALGFASREDLAAATFAKRGAAYGYSPEEISAVQSAIIPTRRGEIPTTKEGVVTVIADMSNVAASFDIFAGKTQDFEAETKRKYLADHKLFKQSEYLAESIKIICEYAYNLTQGPLDVTVYLRRAIPNIRRLVRQVAREEHCVPYDYIAGLNTPVVAKLLSLRLPLRGAEHTEDS